MFGSEFLRDVGIPALVGAGAGWLSVKFLAAKLIQHRLSKDLETFKDQLTQRADVLKTQLGIFAHEQNVSISRVDAQRADAVRQVFASIRAVHVPLARIVSGCPFVNATSSDVAEYYRSHAEAAYEGSNRLTQQLADLAIYFDGQIFESLGHLTKVTSEATSEYLVEFRRLRADGATAEQILTATAPQREVLKKVFSSDIKPREREAIERFRRLLGIERGST